LGTIENFVADVNGGKYGKGRRIENFVPQQSATSCDVPPNGQKCGGSDRVIRRYENFATA